MLGTAQVNLSDVCLCVVGEVIMYVLLQLVLYLSVWIYAHVSICVCV